MTDKKKADARAEKNRARLVAALQEHGYAVLKGNGSSSTLAAVMPGPAGQEVGEFLYRFLDAAFGKQKPADMDPYRKNAVRWVRDWAKKAQL